MRCGQPATRHKADLYITLHTKSYFQLFNDNLQPGTWEAAKSRAAAKIFKGVHGRLAVVDSMETHQFILKNFGLKWPNASVWIGLRYWCSVRMLQWEGGRPYSPSEMSHFRIWHNPWARPESGEGTDSCDMAVSRTKGFAPVYYRNIGGIVRWQAVGAAKFFPTYLVEFVTSGE